MSFTLALNTTSLNFINLCLFDNLNNRFYSKVSNNKSSAADLIKLLAEVMSEEKIAETKIERILVNTGPGSFTGIRNGLITAISLGIAWGVDVFSTSVLNAEVSTLPTSEHNFFFKLANRNELYFQYFVIAKQKIIQKSVVEFVVKEKLDEFIAKKSLELKLDLKEIKVFNLDNDLKDPAHATLQLFTNAPELFDMVYNANTLECELVPNYVKDVNAKTLEQRGI